MWWLRLKWPRKCPTDHESRQTWLWGSEKSCPRSGTLDYQILADLSTAVGTSLMTSKRSIQHSRRIVWILAKPSKKCQFHFALWSRKRSLEWILPCQIDVIFSGIEVRDHNGMGSTRFAQCRRQARGNGSSNNWRALEAYVSLQTAIRRKRWEQDLCSCVAFIYSSRTSSATSFSREEICYHDKWVLSCRLCWAMRFSHPMYVFLYSEI